ncbi:MAG: preprotein translocase subunit SecE [Maricaulaceae bacterium]|jgi:preprotein translocase subunit SecE
MAESKGINPIRFFTEVRQEARKVTWTPWRETAITTVMVFIMVTLAALFFLAVDGIFSWVVQFLLNLAGGA